MRKIIFIIVLYSAFSICEGQNVTSGQEQPVTTLLKKAEAAFQSGSFLECSDITGDLLENPLLRKPEKLAAMELAAKSAVEMGETGKADSYINVMLKLFPHYDLKPEENSEEFNRLVRKYEIHPAISIGVRNTADFMNYKTMEVFSYNGVHYDTPYQKELEGILNDFGIMYYGWAEIEFARGFSVNGDLTFKWTNFNRDLASSPPFDLSFWEHNNYMEMPIYIKKYFKVTKNTMAYAAGGVGWLCLLNATGNADIYYQANDSLSSMRNFDMLPFRNRNTLEWLAGAGFGYKYRNLRMFFDLRYCRGMSSITDPERVLTDDSLFGDFLYLDNPIRLTQFELGVSISYTLFNSVKKTTLKRK